MAKLRTFSGLGTLCGLSVLVAVAVAWKLGCFPVSISKPETGTLAELPEDNVILGRPDNSGGLSDEAFAFPDQSEPAAPAADANLGPVEVASNRDVLNELRAVLAEIPQPTNVAAGEAATPSRPGPVVQAQTDRWEWQTLPGEPESPPAAAGPVVQVAYQAESDDASESAGAVTGTLDAAAEQKAAAGRKSSAPPAQPPAEEGLDLAAIDALIGSGEDVAAHRALSRLYWDRTELRPEIEQRLETLAQRIYWSPQPHYMPPYEVQPGDQLRLIAQQYRVPWEYLTRLNRIDPRRIRPGQKLKVIKGPFSAFVDLSDFELTIHAHGYYVRRYRVGIGRDGSSPIGTFTVINKVRNPQYTDPEGRVIAGDDPENPLGEHWIDIGDSFGIHGTIDPLSIGKAESRGCIRLRNEDVSVVYDLLEVGSEVVIRP